MNAENPLQRALYISAETSENFGVELARLNNELADGWRVVETTQLSQGALLVIEKLVSAQEIENRRKMTEHRVEVLEGGSDRPIVTPPPDQSAS